MSQDNSVESVPNEGRDVAVTEIATSGNVAKRKERPSYPTVERQILGVALFVFTIIAVEAFASRFGPNQNAGLIILVAMILATYWAGLRTGLICCGLLLAYVLTIYAYPVSALKPKPENKMRAVTQTVIVYPMVAILVGVMTGKLRKARAREFDAQVTAEREAQQRLESERELQRSEDLQRLVLESAMDAVIAIKEDGTVKLWNPIAEKLFGWTNDEVMGKSLAELIIPAGQQEEHKQGLQRFLETNEGPILGHRLDLTGITKSGQELAIELSVVAHKTHDGHVFVGFVRDVSDRKEAEEAIRRLNADLERRVRERTAELDAALRVVEDQKDVALEASRFKSEFVSNMSHELRTPLNSVLGFAQLLEMRYDDPGVREPTIAIMNAGQHLLNLINEVLDLARIESGQMSLSLEPIGIGEVLDQAVDLVRSDSEKSGVQVLVDHSSVEQAHVLADRRRLLQVLINVLSNGIKYNRPDGQVHVKGSTTEDGLFEILVSDTGPGISESDQKALFQPFVRLGEHSVEGSGLGLALSKDFLELMGGSLSLSESGPDGSTFCVSLVMTDPVPVAAPAEHAATPPSQTVVAGEHSILYIEDNLSNIRLLELAFAEWGDIKFESARNGTLGLQRARATKPDLILLDLHLPDLQGEEVLRQLKCDPATKETPVVVVSADATPAQVKRLLAAGAQEYLTKPIELQRLAKVVNKVFQKKTGA